MPIYSPNIYPKIIVRDNRYKALALAWVIMAILSMMYLGATLSSWRATNRAWAEEDKSALPQKYGVQVNAF